MVSGCSTINVNLRNVVSNLFAFLNGNYQIATIVNGKPSWKNAAYAIWYVQTYNVWSIGFLREIGNDASYLSATNDFSGITDNDSQWQYWSLYGFGWITPSDPNDIQITCMDGKYTV